MVRSLKNSRVGPLLTPLFKVLSDVYLFRIVPLIPEKVFIKQAFRNRLGYEPDLDNP